MGTFKKFTSALVVVFFLAEMLPDNWHDAIHFGGVPLSGILMAALCLCLFFVVMVVPRLLDGWVWGGLLATAAMAIGGYFRGNIDAYTLKFFVADLYCFLSLVSGYAFGCFLGRDATEALTARIAVAAGIAIILNYIGLTIGIVHPSFEVPGRFVSSSIFIAVGALMIFLPWASVSSLYSGKKTMIGPGWLYLTTIATGVMSATRTILIGSALIALLYFLLKRHRMGVSFIVRFSTLLLLAIGIFVSGASRFGDFAFQRLDETQIQEESRWQELKLWWPQVKDDLVLGQGMGSRFVSNVVVEGNPLASATHIGIVTFLMKGGVVLFLCCAIFPLVKGVRIMLTPSLPESQRAAAASVLMFIGLSCLSGGWYQLSLFAYGLAIVSMSPERRKHRVLSEPSSHSAGWIEHTPMPALQR